MMLNFASLLEGIVRDVQDHTEKERKSVLSLKSLTESAVQSEVRFLPPFVSQSKNINPN